MDREEKQKEGIFNTEHASMLDADWRVQELQPERLIGEIAKVRTGETCVDFGSGTGTLAIPMAASVGQGGRVYAVDNSDKMLGIIRAKKPPQQLIPVKTEVLETGLESGIADICLLAFIVHEVEQQDRLIAEASRLLKPGGRIIVLEWRADADMPIPPRHRRISREKIEELFRQAGLVLKEYIERTERHYAAVGEKQVRRNSS